MMKDLPEGQTHSYNDGCGMPEHNDVVISCLSINCPERKSLCCGAISKASGNTSAQFFCSKCDKPFVGGKCNATKNCVYCGNQDPTYVEHEHCEEAFINGLKAGRKL